MHVVKSNSATKIAYGEPPVVFAAFETKTLADEDWDRLTAKAGDDTDTAFSRHLKNGSLTDVPQQAAVEAKPAPVTPFADDPRKQRTGEKKAAYEARLAALDAADAEAKFVTDFLALTPEEQEAMSGTLTDEQKAAIAAAKTGGAA